MSSKALKMLAVAYGQYFNLTALFSKRLAAKKAFKLFCTPRKGRLLAHQKTYLAKFKQQEVEVANHKIQTYHQPGEKARVLLCHGWESNAFRWRKLLEKLEAANYEVIFFDAPAHGASSGGELHVPVYESCATALIEKFKPAYVIGHSIGGLAVLYSQYKKPQTSVEKLVSLGAPSELSEIMRNYQHLVGFNRRVLKGLDSYFKERFSFGVNEFSMSELVKKIDVKGLLVHDLSDPIAPYSAATRMHENWKNAQLLTTEGLGHSLHQDQVNEQIIAFLEAS